jgi:hypothetical protein
LYGLDFHLFIKMYKNYRVIWGWNLLSVDCMLKLVSTICGTY